MSPDWLGKHGCSLDDVVYVHVFVPSMADFKAFNAVYCQFFGANPPSR